MGRDREGMGKGWGRDGEGMGKGWRREGEGSEGGEVGREKVCGSWTGRVK
jgi:hypothetical protein